MYIKHALIALLCFLSVNLNAQIKIAESGEGWKEQVEEAIQLIKDTDTSAYRILIENCKEVEYIIGSFSTTYPPNRIAITVNDMKMNSVNNIACILIHESCHLYVYNQKLEMESPDYEEYLCYSKEYDFLCKLSYVEDWLFQNTINKLLFYKAKSNRQE